MACRCKCDKRAELKLCSFAIYICIFSRDPYEKFVSSNHSAIPAPNAHFLPSNTTPVLPGNNMEIQNPQALENTHFFGRRCRPMWPGQGHLVPCPLSCNQVPYAYFHKTASQNGSNSPRTSFRLHFPAPLLQTSSQGHTPPHVGFFFVYCAAAFIISFHSSSPWLLPWGGWCTGDCRCVPARFWYRPW